MVASRWREGYRIPPENRVYVRVNRDSSAIFGARTRVSLYILRKRAPRRLVIGRILMGVGQLSRRRETRRRPRRCDGTMDAGTINRGHRRQLQRRVPDAFVRTYEREYLRDALWNLCQRAIKITVRQTDFSRRFIRTLSSHLVADRILWAHRCIKDRTFTYTILLYTDTTFRARAFLFSVISRDKWRRLSQTFRVSGLIIRTYAWFSLLRAYALIFLF